MNGRRRGIDRLAACAGIAGASVIGVGSMVTAVAYRGADVRPYSPLNQFVSELGELAQSELAGVFNVSLIVGGVCFVAFMGGLAVSGPGILRTIAGGVGVAAGLGGSFVGVFPMDYPDQHIVAASTFFNLGWIAVGLASLDFVIRRDPRFPALARGRRVCHRRNVPGLPPRARRQHERQWWARHPGHNSGRLGSADARVADDRRHRRLGAARRRVMASCRRYGGRRTHPARSTGRVTSPLERRVFQATNGCASWPAAAEFLRSLERRMFQSTAQGTDPGAATGLIRSLERPAFQARWLGGGSR